MVKQKIQKYYIIVEFILVKYIWFILIKKKNGNTPIKKCTLKNIYFCIFHTVSKI